MLKQLVKITAFVGLFLSMSLAQAADLFSADWMKAFGELWNNDSEITAPLAKINFNSNIAYGIRGDDNPKGILIVENGNVTRTGAYNGEKLNWDLRAKKASWEKWIAAGKISKTDMALPGMWGGLQFKKGNYSAMVKNPSMMGPFMRSFTLMGKVK